MEAFGQEERSARRVKQPKAKAFARRTKRTTINGQYGDQPVIPKDMSVSLQVMDDIYKEESAPKVKENP